MAIGDQGFIKEFKPPGLAPQHRLQGLGARSQLRLPIRQHDAIQAGGDRQAHRDPCDRLLASQAELEGFILVSLDPALAAFPCRLLW
ncbi:MAG: hypothetical protein ACKO8I_02285 [Cyanobacteriota bacterium]